MFTLADNQFYKVPHRAATYPLNSYESSRGVLSFHRTEWRPVKTSIFTWLYVVCRSAGTVLGFCFIPKCQNANWTFIFLLLLFFKVSLLVNNGWLTKLEVCASISIIHYSRYRLLSPEILTVAPRGISQQRSWLFSQVAECMTSYAVGIPVSMFIMFTFRIIKQCGHRGSCSAG